MIEHAILLSFALVLDWFIGDPKGLWDRLPHPVVGYGKMISGLEGWLNKAENSAAVTYRRGAIVIVALIVFSVLVGHAANWLLGHIGWVGWAIEILIIWVFLAQKSLLDHVLEVATGLREGGLTVGRKAVSLIVGRNPETLDESGVSRAAIESLAENFCDGIVAPAFWYLVFGLPGLLAYKMINTADSMIAHKSVRYLHFGRVAAKIDDAANWVPARLSALFIGLSGSVLFGMARGVTALKIVLRDAGLHRSPNAGWPESAMAGICNFALGGPRIYAGESVSQAFINGSGKRDLSAGDIEIALKVYTHGCFWMWAVLAALLIVL